MWFRAGPAGLVVIALVVLAGLGGGGFYAYQAYDYVQHDNDFCVSCHLMENPYDLFAESAHRGLSCKACHQPSMVERTQMAATQIIQDPEIISVHAAVPNERCVSCHVEGDPEVWRLIAQSAGHRVHLESTDSALVGISCVECHSTSLHEFAPVTSTCAQSGCHTDNQVQLGMMSDLTIHCVACHSFSAPLDPVTTAQLASEPLTPGGSDCLTCHAMRVLAQMPEEDPHEQQCSFCHNPHEQSDAAEAVQTCAIGGCHDDPDALTPFHRGLHGTSAEDCTSCHNAHDFSLTGDNCVSCHQDIFDGPGTSFDTGRRIGATSSASDGTAVAELMRIPATALAHSAYGGDDSLVWPDPDYEPSSGPSASARPGEDREMSGVAHATSSATARPGAEADTVTFRHAEHRNVDCTACHSAEEAHGGLTVTSIDDCRSCHHSAPLSDDCTSCHTDSGRFRPPSDLSRAHAMAFEVKSPVVRELPFDHDVHAIESCTSCHSDGGGGALSAAEVTCSQCHAEHHDATAGPECRSCHVPAPISAHPVAEVHVTCSGSGCHTESSLDDIPRVREFCLACHQDMVDHKQEDGRPCAGCHTLPPPKNAGA
jgi:nitrate/TMAO reductase-like tetraheme cytochrome c subunit